MQKLLLPITPKMLNCQFFFEFFPVNTDLFTWQVIVTIFNVH